MDNRLHPLRTSQRLLTYLVCGLIAWQPLLPAISATINPVTSGTNMDKAASGVPVMNIATPNGAGISHNQFKDYNVGKEGLILNNATGQLNKTQLGGYIQNNPNLTAGREAKGIINEVTGGSRSQLQGYTEVAGKAANVIVANPYGITCNGCGFINTPNATLTTGKPVLDASGNLQSLDVTKGTITVEGQGLDASQSDALSIISRATEVNAAIHAKDLKVVAGANRVGSDGSVASIAGEGEAPVVAVDTGALGGMYANRIHLVSGEKGVGVNLGNLNARQGDITLDANGKLVLNNSLSSGALTVKADSAELGGDNKATGAATVTAQNGIVLNSGSLVSDSTVVLDGGERVQLSGAKVTAGEDIRLAGTELNIDKDSSADAAGNISLTATAKTASPEAQSDTTDAASTAAQGKVANAGQLTAGKNLTLNADTADNSGSLVAKGTLTAQAKQLTNRGKLVGDTLETESQTLDSSGEMLAGQKLKIAADSVKQSGTVSAKGSADIAARDSLVNETGGSISSDGGLTVKTAQLTNNGTLSAAQLGLESDAIINGGLLQGTQSLSLLSNSLDNQAQGLLLSNEDMQLSATQSDNAGQLIAGNLSFTGDVLNNSGKLQGISSLSLQAITVNNLTGGSLLSGAEAGITADALNNAGQIQADVLTLNAQTLTNRGEWTASNLRITGGSLDNNGAVNGVNSLTAQLTGKLTQQQDKSLQSGGLLKLSAAELDNHGRLQGSTLQLDGDTLTNSGWLQATNLILNVAKAGNTGTLLAEQQATLTGDTLTNSGTIQAGALAADYQQLTNSGTLLGSSDLTLTGGQITQEAAGKLFSGGNLALNASGFDQLGQVVALGNATLKLADSLTSGGTIAAGKTLDITTGGALTTNGAMQGETVVLKVTDALTNGGQIIGGSDDLTLNGNSITSSGSIQGGGDMTLTSNSDITLNGFTGAGGTVTLNAPGTILNTALLYAANNLYLLADNIHNQGGDILAGNSLWMQRDAAGNANTEVVNSSGTIETQDGDITIKTGHLLNTREGLTVSRTTTKTIGLPAGIGAATLSVPLGTLKENELGYYDYPVEYNSGQGEGIIYGSHLYMAPNAKGAEKKYLIESTTITASAEAGMGSIISGQDAYITATTLDNKASTIQVKKSFSLSGEVFNNESWFNGSENKYLTYKYNGQQAQFSLNENYGLSYFSPDNEYAPLRGNTSSTKITYRLASVPEYETTSTGGNYRSVIQAGGDITASFSENISNTTTTANASGISTTIAAPALNTLSNQTVTAGAQNPAAEENTQQWRDQLQNALQSINGGKALQNEAGAGADTSAYPVPASDNGYFVTSGDPTSPYLITVNPALDGVGQLDKNLYGDLYKLLGQQPADAPQETRAEFADKNTFLGSAYMLGRLNLNPEYDYRFLGDAAFDTRYVSNTVLNQTGSRYLNGMGSDLDQMRYLMDNAASRQQSLGLQFGVALTAAQIASLDSSILWWEATTINGETVMVPKLYLSAKDITVSNGSVIAANNVSLEGGSVTNTGSTLLANNDLSVDSQDSISNRDNAAIKAGGALQLSAQGDIDNIGSAISGKTVALESVAGNINNITEAEQWQTASSGRGGERASLSHTYLGNDASITAQDGLSLTAGKNITVTGAEVKAGGDLALNAGGDIAVTANTVNNSQSQSGFAFNHRYQVMSSSSSTVSQQGSTLSAGGNLAMQAGNNLTLSASAADAGKSATLVAGNDISLDAQTTRQASSRGASESHKSGVAQSTITSGDNLTLTAGNDLTSQAAALKAGGDVALQAGRDIDLTAQATSSGNSYRSSNKTVINESVRQQGTDITSGGDTMLTAGRDISSAATSVNADKAIALNAGGDISLSTATESDYHYDEETTVKKRHFSKTTTHTINETRSTTEKGTQLSGESVALKAGEDITLTGAAIGGEKSVSLDAGNDLNIEAATQTASTYRLHEVKKSGLMGSGLGFTIGKQSAKGEYKGAQVTQSDSRSMVGVAEGNVSLNAGNNLLIKGSDLIAGRAADDTTGATGNITANAQNIALLAGQDQVRESYTQETKSSGIGLSLNISALNAVRNIRDALKSSSSLYQQVKAVGNEMGAVTMDPDAPALTYSKSSANSSQTSDALFQKGSTLSAGGDVTLTATADSSQPDSGNILLQGGSIVAGGAASLQASGDIGVVTASDGQKVSSGSESKALNLTSLASLGSLARMVGDSPNNGAAGVPLGVLKEEQKSNGTYLTQHAASVSGNTVALASEKGDITLAGSTLTGVQGVSVSAASGNVNVVSGENQQSLSTSGSSKTLGELGGDGYSGTVGWGNNKWQNASTGSQQNSVRSGIVSEQGDVRISGAQDVTLQGADVYAGKTLDVEGRNVSLLAGQDNEKNSSSSRSAQYGITGAVSGYAISVAQAVDKVADAHKNDDDPRLQAIYAAQAALTALSGLYQQTAVVKVTVSATAGTSHQSQEQQNSAQSGSSLKADQDVAIKAEQDITGQGVQISGENVALTAGGDIALTAARDTSSLQSSSGGNKYGVGVGFGIGKQTGFTIELSASQYRGKADGSNLTHHNSQVDASKTLTVSSGEDITLNGANLSGDEVKVNAGKDLHIASPQDTAKYDSKQSSSGLSMSICVPPICGGQTVSAENQSGSASMSGSKLYNDYASVRQQSGIAAGDGGYNIFVGNHTQLDGAVISSTASEDKNTLSTGTLGWTDIDNHANQGASGYSVSVSASAMPVTTLGQAKDKASSTTYSAVSPGTIDIRDTAAQQQDVATLSRDTAHANNALENNFDAQKLEDKIAIQRELAALGQQAIGLAFDYQKDKAEKAARARLTKEDPTFAAKSAEEQKKAIKESPELKAADEEYGIGSKYQIAAQALVGALSALAGGNQSGALAAGAAPLLAQTIKQATEGNEALRVMLHTVVSGLLAKAQGGSVAGGAAGGLISAAGAETLSRLFLQKEVEDLTSDEKILLANLVTLAGAGAGAVAGGGSAGAASGASAARTEVENNYLSEKESRQLDKEMQDCKASGGDCKSVVEKYIEISNKNSKELIESCTGGGVTCVTWQELIQGATNVANDPQPGQFRLDEKLKDPSAAALVNYLNGTDLKFLNDNITTGDRVMSVVMDPTSWPVAIMGGKAIITNVVNNTKEQLIAVGVGAGLGAGIQYGTTGEVKLSDVIGSAVIGAITAGKGYNPTVTWNAAGSYYQAEISGDDPFMAALLSKTGASVGYAAGNIIKVPMDKVLNPVSKQYEWVPTGVWTITKPVPQSSLPSIMGNVGDSFASDATGDTLEKAVSGGGNGNK